MPWVDKKKCSGCGVCLSACTVKAISMGIDKKAVIDDNLCTRCAECFIVCPLGAIRSNSENLSMRRGSGMGGGGKGMHAGRETGRGEKRGRGGL